MVVAVVTVAGELAVRRPLVARQAQNGVDHAHVLDDEHLDRLHLDDGWRFR